MPGWTHHEGTAVHLPAENVDTDQLIPARFMSAPRSAGYGGYLLHDVRRDQDGALRADFPLNKIPNASVLFAGRNFGSGSSREAAVYALVDAGFRVVVAPSFGDIFASNAVNNGLCPARMTVEDITALAAQSGDGVRVDLDARHITAGDVQRAFVLEDSWATKLINGWDDIDLTLQHKAEIARYRAARAGTGWLWPQV